MEDKLKALRLFQEQNKSSHVGGSIGLYLHGFDLGRPLHNSDFDITIDEFTPNYADELIEENSGGTDFDYCLRIYRHSRGLYYDYFDIRVNPEPSFVKIHHKGHFYNVSKIDDIIFWKRKYAKKGYEKHCNDMRLLTGEVYEITKKVHAESEDGLPF